VGGERAAWRRVNRKEVHQAYPEVGRQEEEQPHQTASGEKEAQQLEGQRHWREEGLRQEQEEVGMGQHPMGPYHLEEDHQGEVVLFYSASGSMNRNCPQPLVQAVASLWAAVPFQALAA